VSTASGERVPTLAELQKWARDPTGDNWQNLLRVLTDLFIADVESNAARYGEAYSEIVCKMLDDVAADVRAELSERIAPMAHFPDKVVQRLAHDEETSVSAPVLEHSPVLTEADLLGIIEMMTPDRTLAISKRKQLGKKITDVLIANGDEAVVRSVTANPGAAFSERTMRKVAERAKHDPELCGSLVDRADISQAVMVQLTPFLSEEIKARLEAFDEKDSGSLLDSLSQVTGESDKGEPSRKNRIEAFAAIEQVKSGQASMDETAARIAAVGHASVLFLFIAEMGQIAEKSVSGAFAAKNGTPFAVMCKGLRLSKQTFSAIAQLRAKRVGMSDADTSRYVEAFTRLNAGEAEKTLKMLQEKDKDNAGAGNRPAA